MNKHTLIAGLMLSTAALAAAERPHIFPTPQQTKLQDSYTRVNQVQILPRKEKSSGGMWDILPADNEGAYALEITNGKLTVWANSKVALHYAKQTLSQLLRGIPGADNAQKDPFPGETIDQVAKKGELPLGTVADWPDLPFRGTVEGYYGAPWSYEARKSQFEFYGRNKLNTYIYAPKDDPFHHGLGCYKPYPAAKAREIRELVQHARRNHVRFVWAIHPADTVRWEENGGKKQLDALCHKLKLMYDLGVRDFGVLVDDSSGEIGKASRQVQLCNYILENFIRKHKDVNQTLIMCPTGYNKSWTNAQFLQTLGNGLDKSIPVMWTGDTVVNDITLQGQHWVNEHVKRPTFIWWNWPCNDFKRSRISMGRTYGLGTEPEMKSAMSGFVANPMEHAEASKVGIFGVADYTWNITGFESDKSWRAGIARLYPGCAEAMQCFCEHNSYLLPNTHKYFREESVHISDLASAFTASLDMNAPDTAAAAGLQEEFERMEKAGLTLSTAEGIKDLQEDIAPWISQFILAGQAGTSAMKAIRATKQSARIQHFFRAVDTHIAMADTKRDEWTPKGTKFVKNTEVAMYCMTPAIRATLRYLSNAIGSELGVQAAPAPAFSANKGEALAEPRILADNSPDTFWSSDARQEAGDWYCLDFGTPTTIHNIVMLTGGPRSGDIMKKGQFEISDDGKNWRPVGKPIGGCAMSIDLESSPVKARMLRYRILEPMHRRAAICEFGINRGLPSFVDSNLSKAPALSQHRNEEEIGLNRIMEVFTIQPGEYIELHIPGAISPEALDINLENAELSSWANISLTLADGSTTRVRGETENNHLHIRKQQLPNKPVSAVRLTNSSKKAREIQLTQFRLALSEKDADTNIATLTDSDLTTRFDNSQAEMQVNLAVPANTGRVLVLGTARCTLNGAEPTRITDYVQEFILPQDTSRIRLEAPRKENTATYEVIFAPIK